MKKEVYIYTDGSCKGNPGKGGWCAILIYKGVHKKIVKGCKDYTTNGEMELRAVCEGLKALKEDCIVYLYSDSQYIVNGISEWLANWKSRGWRKSNGKVISHKEMWMEIDELLQRHNVFAYWVKGHSGNVYNEECDSIASWEAEKC